MSGIGSMEAISGGALVGIDLTSRFTPTKDGAGIVCEVVQAQSGQVISRVPFQVDDGGDQNGLAGGGLLDIKV